MRFLVDANMSPLAERLRAVGHDAVAVRDVGLGDASDDEILDRAIVVMRFPEPDVCRPCLWGRRGAIGTVRRARE